MYLNERKKRKNIGIRQHQETLEAFNLVTLAYVFNESKSELFKVASSIYLTRKHRLMAHV